MYAHVPHVRHIAENHPLFAVFSGAYIGYGIGGMCPSRAYMAYMGVHASG